MRDMKTKFGVQVESFRYSFVLPDHGSEWDGANSPDPDGSRTVPARAVSAKARAASPAAQATRTAPRPPPVETRMEALPAPRRRTTDKQPTFIEVKPSKP